MNFPELIEQLKQEEETVLLELLELTSSDIVDSFQDKIKENIERVYKFYA